MTPKRASSIAVVESVQIRFFKVTVAAEAIGYVCQTRFECPVAKGQRVVSKPPGERELEIVLEAQTRHPLLLIVNLFQWLASHSTRGSEAEPTTNSRYSFFQDRERSLEPGRLRRALKHSRTPVEKWRLSPYVPTPCPSTMIGQLFQRAIDSPDQASLDTHVEDVGSRPVFGSSPFDYTKVIWRDIVLAPAVTPSLGKYGQPVKDQGIHVVSLVWMFFSGGILSWGCLLPPPSFVFPGCVWYLGWLKSPP